MKVIYRGHEIEVKREKCLAGYGMLYTSVFDPDGVERVGDVEDSGEKVRDQIKYMKERIDAELASDKPWDDDEHFSLQN